LIVFVIAIVWPTVLCIWLGRVYQREGSGALWRWAGGAALVLGLFAFLNPSMTYYQTDPLVGAGLLTIPFPVAALVAAGSIHGVTHLGAPRGAAVVLASIASTVVANSVQWIA